MKNLIFLLSIAALISCAKNDQAKTLPGDFQGNYYIRSQSDADAFNFTSISRNLYIEDADVVDLSGLSSLRSVGGKLYIARIGASNLNGLQNLETIGNLEPIERSLEIRSCPNLTSLSGLEGLSNISGGLVLFSLRELRSIEALSNLSGELAFITMVSLDVLENIDGLNGIQSAGKVELQYLFELTNLDGFSNLTSVTGNFYLRNLWNLSDLHGLSNLTSIGTRYDFVGDFPSQFWFENARALPNFDGMENLVFMGKLRLEGCSSLTNLDGLTNTSQTYDNGFFISIVSNDVLTDYCGITNFVSLNDPDNFFGFTVGGNLYNPTLAQVRSSTECRL